MTKCSFLFKLLMVTLVAAALSPWSVNADDAAERNERQFAELNEQMQQMRAELEELRTLLREMRTDREATKPELPPELQERLHGMKNEIQELMQSGRVDEANAVEREAHALLERFAAAHQGEPEKVATEVALPPELAERLAGMKREIQELREAGRLDAAEALERETRNIVDNFAAEHQRPQAYSDRPEWMTAEAEEQLDRLVEEVNGMRRVIRGQRDAGRLSEAEMLEYTARQINLGAFTDDRLDHLRAAADHLEAAGRLDLAEPVQQEITQLEREGRE